MKKKSLASLEDFKKLNKADLIDELMKKTIKGGCCSLSTNRRTRSNTTQGPPDNDMHYDNEIE